MWWVFVPPDMACGRWCNPFHGCHRGGNRMLLLQCNITDRDLNGLSRLRITRDGALQWPAGSRVAIRVHNKGPEICLRQRSVRNGGLV